MTCGRCTLITILMVASAIVPAVVQADTGARQSPKSLDQWRAEVTEASQRFHMPVTWIEGVIRAESAGKTTLNGQPITSRAGAMGLMQLMPETYAEMQKLYGLGSDPYAPRDNIMAGTAYLRLQYEQFGYPGLFGAYNAGPARYEASLRGRQLPRETRNYLRKLTNSSPTILSGTILFIDLNPAEIVPETTAQTDLFVPLSASKSGDD